MAEGHPWRSGQLGERIELWAPSVGKSFSRGDPPQADRVSAAVGSAAPEPWLFEVDGESLDSEDCVSDTEDALIRPATAPPEWCGPAAVVRPDRLYLGGSR